jgi:hypothetical protein
LSEPVLAAIDPAVKLVESVLQDISGQINQEVPRQ